MMTNESSFPALRIIIQLMMTVIKEQLQQFIQDVITETSLGMGFWAQNEQHEETKT